MLKQLITIIGIFVLPSGGLFAQSGNGTLVSFDYRGDGLSHVIGDLEDRFALNFTYSPSRLPMDYPINAEAQSLPVDAAMDRLFAAGPIKHAFIGDQIVLRSDPGRLTQIQPRAIQPRQKSPIYEERPPRDTPPAVPEIPTREPRQISGGDQWQSDQLAEEDWESVAQAMDRHERRLAREEYKATHRLAQISLLPYLGTNTHRSNEVTNNLSFNVFWGTSRAVDGFELGGIANSVTEDMHGFQMAGVLNQVGGEVIGTQFAGGVNHAGGTVHGAQVAGIFNVAVDNMTGAQVAGGANIAKRNLKGSQTAGIFNWAQGDVQHQTSSLFNRARYVAKRQVGVINVCDTTAKAPYGLLNFVKYGYNRLEIGSTENMYVNLGAKLGVHKLYNILQLGVRWDLETGTVDNRTSEAMYTTWALGYGLGVAPRLGRKVLLNLEAVALHVNETEAWTEEVNLLGQFRMTLDYRTAGRLSFYAGPTLNVMWSKLYDADTDTYGSRLPHEPLWNRQNGDMNNQGWIGFTAGLRF